MSDDTKPGAKAEGDKAETDARRPADLDRERDDAAPENGSVQDREDVGAAADPEGPEVVHVITEVNPGTAN